MGNHCSQLSLQHYGVSGRFMPNSIIDAKSLACRYEHTPPHHIGHDLHIGTEWHKLPNALHGAVITFIDIQQAMSLATLNHYWLNVIRSTAAHAHKSFTVTANTVAFISVTTRAPQQIHKIKQMTLAITYKQCQRIAISVRCPRERSWLTALLTLCTSLRRLDVDWSHLAAMTDDDIRLLFKQQSALESLHIFGAVTVSMIEAICEGVAGTLAVMDLSRALLPFDEWFTINPLTGRSQRDSRLMTAIASLHNLHTLCMPSMMGGPVASTDRAVHGGDEQCAEDDAYEQLARGAPAFQHPRLHTVTTRSLLSARGLSALARIPTITCINMSYAYHLDYEALNQLAHMHNLRSLHLSPLLTQPQQLQPRTIDPETDRVMRVIMQTVYLSRCARYDRSIFRSIAAPTTASTLRSLHIQPWSIVMGDDHYMSDLRQCRQLRILQLHGQQMSVPWPLERASFRRKEYRIPQQRAFGDALTALLTDTSPLPGTTISAPLWPFLHTLSLGEWMVDTFILVTIARVLPEIRHLECGIADNTTHAIAGLAYLQHLMFVTVHVDADKTDEPLRGRDIHDYAIAPAPPSLSSPLLSKSTSFAISSDNNDINMNNPLLLFPSLRSFTMNFPHPYYGLVLNADILSSFNKNIFTDFHCHFLDRNKRAHYATPMLYAHLIHYLVSAFPYVQRLIRYDRRHREIMEEILPGAFASHLVYVQHLSHSTVNSSTSSDSKSDDDAEDDDDDDYNDDRDDDVHRRLWDATPAEVDWSMLFAAHIANDDYICIEASARERVVSMLERYLKYNS